MCQSIIFAGKWAMEYLEGQISVFELLLYKKEIFALQLVSLSIQAFLQHFFTARVDYFLED